MASATIQKEGTALNGQRIYWSGAIELIPNSSATYSGYIDFHFGGSSDDFTSRIIEAENGVIQINGLKFNKSHCWTSLQLETGFISFADAYTPKFCVIGDICYCSGIIKSENRIAVANMPVHVATLPTGAHTQGFTEMYFVGQSNGINCFALHILQTGRMTIDRYGYSDTAAAIAAGAYLAFSVAFPVI